MEKKKDAVYIGLLFLCIFVIYNTINKGVSDLQIDDVMQENVLILTLGNYFYAFLGVIMLAFTAYLYTHMSAYKVGKIFAGYIAVVSMGICIIAITDYRYTGINIIVGLLAIVSNYLLLYTIGCLTLVIQKQYYKWIITGYTAAIICESVVFLIYSKMNCSGFSNVWGNYITGEYAFTIIFIIISMMAGYKESTKYSKSQIKILTAGMVSGIFIVLLSCFLPTIAVVEVPLQKNKTYVEVWPENDYEEEPNYTVVHVENDVRKNTYPIIVFTGIVIVILYILIKRKYLAPEGMGIFKCYLGSVVYLLVANTIFRLIVSEHKGDFFVFDFLNVIPLFLYGHGILQKENNLYRNNMLEVIEEERKKLSIYLHDEVLQSLITVQYSSDPEVINKEVAVLIEDIRNVSQSLYPTIAEDLGLEEAIRIFIDELNIDYNVEITYQYNYPAGILPTGISLTLYRIVKELVTNAMKYSEAVHICVYISEAKEGIQCNICDDGKGFQMPGNDQLLKSPHMGLYTVRKQIADLSGTMQVVSDTSGSEFQLYIPLR